MNLGDRFGRWTVIACGEPTQNGQKRWLCRCDCGTERLVLERSLKYGGSESCGCVTREKAAGNRKLDLQGLTFGKLTVLARADKKAPNGGVCWLCRCECGAECIVAGTLLKTGRKTSCGCDVQKNYAFADIQGQTFHCLTALYRLPQNDAAGSVMWRCRCVCGNEVDVSYNHLLYSNVRSCGCRKKEQEQALNGFLTHVAGTSVDMLKSKKLPKNNSTGVKGVYLIKGRYVAKIVFQKKQYVLGSFEHFEEAREARQEAEELLNDVFVAYYEQWRRKADANPEWGRSHPVQVEVKRDAHGRLALNLWPVLQTE